MQEKGILKGLRAAFVLVFIFLSANTAAFAGQATLSWSAPPANTDGTELTDLAGYKVNYGTASGVYTQKIDVGNVNSHTLSNLSDGTYYFAVSAYNALGKESAYSNEATKTIAVVDNTAPSISGVYAGSITSESAAIHWVTNELSDSQVDYGGTTAYGSSTPLDSAMVTAHSMTISGLAPGMAYNFRVSSRDSAGNLAASSNYAFTTLVPADTAPPALSNIVVSNIGETSATVTWATDEPSTTLIEYGEGASTSVSYSPDSKLVTIHRAELTGLSSFTAYSFVVKSADVSGNVSASAAESFTTSNQPPALTSFSATTLSGYAPLSMTFNASAADNDGIITNYEWDFDGDGIYDLDTGNLSSTAYTYSSVGTYNAKVRIRDNGGAVSESDTLTVSVESASNKPPVIVSIVGTMSQNGSEVILTFNVSASDPNGVIVRFDWDFDGNGTIDASTATAPATYTYAEPGTYTPSVTIVDDQGGVAKGVTTVTVEEPTATTVPMTETLVSQSPGGASGGGCFIATAAFGSYLEPEVMVLREFRDNMLLTNRPGKAFVSLYYRFSPPVAGFIARHESLRTAARAVLTPVVYGIKYPGASTFIFLTVGLAVFGARLRKRK